METLATFSKPEDAHLLRMRLEAVGIKAVLLDENMSQLEQPVFVGVGGVRLQVAEADVVAARDLVSNDRGAEFAE